MGSNAFVHAIYIWEPDAPTGSTPFERVHLSAVAASGGTQDWALEEIYNDDLVLLDLLNGKATGIYSIMAILTLTAVSGGYYNEDDGGTEVDSEYAVVERLSEDEFSRSPASGVNLSDEDKQLLFEPEKPVGIILKLEAL